MSLGIAEKAFAEAMDLLGAKLYAAIRLGADKNGMLSSR